MAFIFNSALHIVNSQWNSETKYTILCSKQFSSRKDASAMVLYIINILIRQGVISFNSNIYLTEYVLKDDTFESYLNTVRSTIMNCVNSTESQLVRDMFALVRDMLALVRDMLALVRDIFALVRDMLALVCDMFALARDMLALVSDMFAPSHWSGEPLHAWLALHTIEREPSVRLYPGW